MQPPPPHAFDEPCDRCLYHRTVTTHARACLRTIAKGLQKLRKKNKRRKARAKASRKRAATFVAAMHKKASRRAARAAVALANLTTLAEEQGRTIDALRARIKHTAAAAAAAAAAPRKKSAKRNIASAVGEMWKENAELRAQLGAPGPRAPQACNAKQQGGASRPPNTKG